jgi:hypothetical protein
MWARGAPEGVRVLPHIENVLVPPVERDLLAFECLPVDPGAKLRAAILQGDGGAGMKFEL